LPPSPLPAATENHRDRSGTVCFFCVSGDDVPLNTARAKQQTNPREQCAVVTSSPSKIRNEANSFNFDVTALVLERDVPDATAFSRRQRIAMTSLHFRPNVAVAS
jgi:hypothetical protein